MNANWYKKWCCAHGIRTSHIFGLFEYIYEDMFSQEL